MTALVQDLCLATRVLLSTKTWTLVVLLRAEWTSIRLTRTSTV
jgi:hypothetical protein